MFDVEKIRADFPLLSTEVYGRPLVYLDSGATAQKPRCVIDTVDYLHRELNANIHRGVHRLAEEATERYEAARDRIRAFIGAAHREDFFTARYDYILDAIDTVSSKLDLIQTAQARGIPILSAMGTGNKLDASQLCITDISKTRNCSLARVMRKELRDRGVKHLRVIYSPELPAKPEALEAPPPGRRSVPASLVWVPGCAGLMMAGDVILTLAGCKKEKEGGSQ